MFRFLNAAVLTTLLAAQVAHSAPLEPYRDPGDQLFRRAPMALSSRSIAIPLSPGVHLAFDSQLLRVHTVWRGPSLDLYGPPFTGTATRFISEYSGTRLWGNPPVFPWRTDADDVDVNPSLPAGTLFRGVSTRGGEVTLIYEIAAGGRSVQIHQSFSSRNRESSDWVNCRVEVGPSAVPLHFLAFAEMGTLAGGAPSAGTAVIHRTNDFFAVALNGDFVTLISQEKDVDYRFLSDTEKGGKGPYSALVTNVVSGRQSRIWVNIPAHPSEIAFELIAAPIPGLDQISSFAKTARALPVAKPRMTSILDAPKSNSPKAAVFLPDPSYVDRPAGDESYRVEHFPIPRDVRLMVGGMDFLPDGGLAISTMLGEVYVVDGVVRKPLDARWRRFARGLNEPLGLKVVDGRVLVTQKCELTRLTDTDGDGEADLFECLSAGWGFNGNYHSFATGPVVDKAGDMFVMVAGHRTVYENSYMGWCMRISPESQGNTSASAPLGGRFVTEGFCSGLRVPNGFGSYQGEVFMTDNQGHWIAANKLNHLQSGKYYGHPSAKPAPLSQFDGDPNFQPPAIWFPYAWVRSASGIETIPDDRFGPFKGQMLVGEFQNANVVRVFLEKVGGEWQGAVFPFVKGFNSGVNRLAFGPDGNLYVGGLRMGHWTSIAPQPHSLDRVRFTGLSPFEIKEVHARKDGFELIFTEPVEPGSAANAESYDASQYYYAYDGRHNAPEKDRDEKIPSQTPTRVIRAELSADRLKVRLQMDGLQKRYVTAVRCLDVKNSAGRKLRNDTFHYTLNAIPSE